MFTAEKLHFFPAEMLNLYYSLRMIHVPFRDAAAKRVRAPAHPNTGDREDLVTDGRWLQPDKTRLCSREKWEKPHGNGAHAAAGREI